MQRLQRRYENERATDEQPAPTLDNNGLRAAVVCAEQLHTFNLWAALRTDRCWANILGSILAAYTRRRRTLLVCRLQAAPGKSTAWC